MVHQAKQGAPCASVRRPSGMVRQAKKEKNLKNST